MKEVDFDVIFDNAKSCHKNKTKWHFHILTPTCMFSSKKQFAIIFEDDEKKEQMVSFFEEKPLKHGEKLEELFYGRA